MNNLFYQWRLKESNGKQLSNQGNTRPVLHFRRGGNHNRDTMVEEKKNGMAEMCCKWAGLYLCARDQDIYTTNARFYHIAGGTGTGRDI